MTDTALRDAIADRYGDKFGTIISESELNRQHLQSFIKKGHGVVGPHFKYIDWFVRSIQFSPEYQPVFERLKLGNDLVNKRVLASLYQSRTTSEWTRSVEAFDIISGYLFELDNRNAQIQNWLSMSANEYRYIGLFIEPESGPIFTARSLHSNVPMDRFFAGDRAIDVQHVIYTGYLIPQAQMSDLHDTFRGVLKLFDPLKDHNDLEDASAGVSSHTSSIIRVVPGSLSLSATWDGVVFSPSNLTMHLSRDISGEDSIFSGKEHKLVKFKSLGKKSQFKEAIEDLTADYRLW